jgi:hypothetical protein
MNETERREIEEIIHRQYIQRGDRDKFTAINVVIECPFVLLVKGGSREVTVYRSGEGTKLLKIYSGVQSVQQWKYNTTPL